MDSCKLKEVSLIGRIAYAIMCAEKFAIEKYPTKNWSMIFKPFWQVANFKAVDEWAWLIMEYMPKYLFEFENFKDAEFEYIDESTFYKLRNIYEGVDDSLNQILLAIRAIEEEYAYSNIPGCGEISLEYLDEIITILKNNNIEPPDLDTVLFSKFSERNGWGNPFDGTKLSIILNKTI